MDNRSLVERVYNSSESQEGFESKLMSLQIKNWSNTKGEVNVETHYLSPEEPMFRTYVFD
jgi:hypothetical protein